MEDKIDREWIYQPISQPNRIFKTVLSSSSSAMSCDNHHKQMAGAYCQTRQRQENEEATNKARQQQILKQ